jgi:hypothetical protein
VLARRARNGSGLADKAEEASEADGKAHNEERLLAKSSEVIAHSAEQVDKIVIETHGQADLLPVDALTAGGAIALVCTVVMGAWMLKFRRKREPATPHTPTELTPEAEQLEGLASPLEPSVVESKSDSRSAIRKVTINRSDSVSSCPGRSLSSTWTSMFHRMTSDPLEHSSERQADEPCGHVVEVMTPRQSTDDDALQPSTGAGEGGRWHSTLVARLLHLTTRKGRTRATTTPAHCFV